MSQDGTVADQGKHFKPPYILSLDVGTSSTRTMLFDSTGATVPNLLARRMYQLTVTGEGEVSVNADDLATIVGQTIDDALKECGSMSTDIAAVSLDTFWHSIVGVDAAGNAITPVITWEDTRPRGAAQELAAQLDEEAIHARTGARLHASYWPAKLRWLAAEQRATFDRVAQWLSFGEYLQRKLLGHSVCSLSMASGTGMLNISKRAWDEQLINVLGIRPEQLPQIGDIGDSIQGLKPEYGSAWPPLRSIPWFPAIGDGAAACIGSGCTNLENWALTIGTSSAIRVVVKPDQVVPPLALWLYLIDTRHAVLGGALSEGGNMLNWVDSTYKLPSLSSAEQLTGALPPDGHGLTILPFISGERSLGWHADAHMTITGISTHTTPAEALRACQEALAYRLLGVYTQLRQTLNMSDKTPRVICSGGALLGSSTLQTIIADTLNATLYPSIDQEASARGAALLALESLKLIPDACQINPSFETSIPPDIGRGEVYRKAAKRQEDLYHTLLG